MALLAVGLCGSAPDLAAAARATSMRTDLMTLGVGAIRGDPGWLAANAAVDRLATLAAAVLLFLLLRMPIGARRGLALGLIALTCAADAIRAEIGGLDLVGTALIAGILLGYFGRGRAVAVGFFGVSIVWCNTSAAGILSPCFAVCVAIGLQVTRPRTKRTAFAWKLAVLGAVAMLATPAGISYPGRAITVLGLDGSLGGLVEFAPMALAPIGYRFGVLALLVVACGVGIRRGRRLRVDWVILVGFALWLACANGRSSGMFGFVTALVLARSVASRRTPEARRPSDHGYLAAAGAVVGLVVLVARGTYAGGSRASGPIAVVSQAAPLGTSDIVFCANLAYCDIVRAERLRTVADLRGAFVDAAVRERQRGIAQMHPGWEARLQATGATAVLARANSAFETELLARGWRRVAQTATVDALRPRATTP